MFGFLNSCAKGCLRPFAEGVLFLCFRKLLKEPKPTQPSPYCLTNPTVTPPNPRNPASERDCVVRRNRASDRRTQPPNNAPGDLRVGGEWNFPKGGACPDDGKFPPVRFAPGNVATFQQIGPVTPFRGEVSAGNRRGYGVAVGTGVVLGKITCFCSMPAIFH